MYSLVSSQQKARIRRNIEKICKDVTDLGYLTNYRFEECKSSSEEKLVAEINPAKVLPGGRGLIGTGAENTVRD
ncbi:MAG: hypothetical protein LC132_06910 [Burkholderiales bacterium]|nr:hypothetical protein [Burkholderiales bacterium]